MDNGTERLPPLHALRAFEAAARHLSFKHAAAELHVTAGAVSHQVKLLESRLGVALFRRLTRALELTPEGQLLRPKLSEGLASIEAAVNAVRRREEACTLNVLAPPNFAARWLIPRLNGFTSAHPDLELHLASRQSMIDGRDAVDLVQRTSDGAGGPQLVGAPQHAPVVSIRFGTGHYPGAQVDEVFAAEYVPVCSPRLLEGDHALRRPEDLRSHTLIHDDTVLDENARPNWSAWLETVGVEGVDAARGPRFSDASLAIEAAIEGMGVALAVKPLLASEIEAGRLVVPFDIGAPANWAYFLVCPEGVADRPPIAAFRRWLLDEARFAKAVPVVTPGSA
jgi:LysR family transcriptional regulator, glycine cleavage system transcriptional activator